MTKHTEVLRIHYGCVLGVTRIRHKFGGTISYKCHLLIANVRTNSSLVSRETSVICFAFPSRFQYQYLLLCQLNSSRLNASRLTCNPILYANTLHRVYASVYLCRILCGFISYLLVWLKNLIDTIDCIRLYIRHEVELDRLSSQFYCMIWLFNVCVI